MTVQELIDSLNKVKDKSRSVFKWDAEYPLIIEGSKYVFLDHNYETISVQEFINSLNEIKDKTKFVYQYFGDRVEDIREIEETEFGTIMW